MGPFEQAHAGDGREDPGQLGHLRHVRLAVEGGLVRVEAEGEVVEGHVADVVAENFCSGASLALQLLRRLRVGPDCFAERGQGVVVGDEVEALPLVLQGDVLLDGPEVVAQVQLAGRLDAGEDSLGRFFSAMTLVSEVKSEE